MKSKNIKSVNRRITEYKAILFDVDGTLYNQRSLRFTMFLHLAGYFITHLRRWKELCILIEYRSVMEHWEHIADASFIKTDYCRSAFNKCELDMEEKQYEYTAKKLRVSQKMVEKTIKYWIHEYPLSLLPKYKDCRLAELLDSLRSRSIITAAYSDYPASKKLEALNINADYIFCSSDKNINCMKPDPKAVMKILQILKLKPSQVLMIGDRYSKDGLAAEKTGMDYIILAKSIPERTKLYQYFYYNK